MRNRIRDSSIIISIRSHIYFFKNIPLRGALVSQDPRIVCPGTSVLRNRTAVTRMDADSHYQKF